METAPDKGLSQNRASGNGLKVRMRRFARNRASVAGFVIIALLLLAALTAGVFAPHDPFAVSRDILASPSWSHPMGTDDIGRDIFSAVWYGARAALLVGLSVAVASSILGIAIGSIAGYYGGIVDTLLMRFTELVQVLPTFFLALALVAITGPGLYKLVIVISALSWPATARLMRVEYYSFKSQDFVEAATTLGQSNLRIMVQHILPNAVPPAVVSGSLVVAQAILLQASLSFFGLGDPQLIDWGQMLNNAQRFLSRAWWLSAFPGAGIFLTVVAFNLVGDGLNDALNPRMRER